ncbi:hypothetical protein ACIPI2_07280 [Micrococcus luteus]|uniref:hypothetical protein n=1 Tax=Micrococcus luteus TaxID=1270 RepID=UPI00380834E7
MSNPFSALAAGGVGGVMAFYKIRKHLARVADPDRVDPSRHFWLFKVAMLSVIVAALWWMVVSIPSDLQALLAVFLVVAAAIVYFFAAMYVNFRAALHRRTTGYVISEDSYKNAPHSIKVSMRRIYKAAAAIETGRAHTDGMFGDIEVTRLVYSAAQRAVLSSELSASTTDLVRVGGIAALAQTGQAQARLKILVNEIKEVERSLGRTKKAAGQLSSDLDDSSRAAEQQRASEARQQRSRTVMDHIEDVTARIDAAAAPDARDIEDRVTSVHAGYVETVTISNQAGGTRTQPESGSTQSNRRHKIARTSWTAAKFTAAGVGKLSTTAARRGFETIEKRRSPQSQPNPVDTPDPSQLREDL